MLGVVALGFTLSAAPVADTLDTDPLELSETTSPGYAAALERFLVTAPARECEVVWMPSFAPELAVYVRRDLGTNAATVVTTRPTRTSVFHALNDATKRIVGRADGGLTREGLHAGLQTELQVETERFEATLSAATADRLRALCFAALSAATPPREGGMGVDGDLVRLRHAEPGVGVVRARYGTSSRNDGDRVLGFLRVAQKLSQFPASPEAERGVLEQQLSADAARELKRWPSPPPGRKSSTDTAGPKSQTEVGPRCPPLHVWSGDACVRTCRTNADCDGGGCVAKTFGHGAGLENVCIGINPGPTTLKEQAVEQYLKHLRWFEARAPCERLAESYATTTERCATQTRVEVQLRDACLSSRPRLFNDAGHRLVMFDGDHAVYRYDNRTRAFLGDDWRSCDGGVPPPFPK